MLSQVLFSVIWVNVHPMQSTDLPIQMKHWLTSINYFHQSITSMTPDVIFCGWLGLKHQLTPYAEKAGKKEGKKRGKKTVTAALVHEWHPKGQLTNVIRKAMKRRDRFKKENYPKFRSKTHKRLKERFLIRRDRTKRANIRCNHLFRATYNTTENS